jgi:glycosyltransferase involved in cell wall biosynthesis
MEPEKRPHISVCIPCYDMGGFGHVFLKESFDKLTEQSFKDFEVVISDYSKTPLVKHLCDAYSNKLPINYFVNTDPTGGMAANTNNAMRHAKGKIIKILFQDDFLYNEKALQTTVKKFKISRDYWLVTGCEHTQDGIHFLRPHYPKYNNQIYIGNNTIGSPTVLTIKNEQPLLFDPKLKWLVDCDYYQRCYNKFGKPKTTRAITVVIRQGKHQITNTEATEALRKSEYNYIVKKYSEKNNR